MAWMEMRLHHQLLSEVGQRGALDQERDPLLGAWIVRPGATTDRMTSVATV